MKSDYNQIARVKKTPQQEEEQAAAIIRKGQNLTELVDDLEALRRRVAVEAKHKDIEYVRKTDRVINTILTTLTEHEEDFKNSILRMLKEGKMRDFKELMVAFGVTVDKREALLGFDETRSMKKRKFRLKVAFKGADGSQAGIMVEGD